MEEPKIETNRLIFTNEDLSTSLAPASTQYSGYMVVKAPKGTTLPQRFPKNSAAKILARIGAPSSTYPGIQEALDYNQYYDLWISAPPGTMAGKSNYYGGAYVTTLASLEPFYQVEDPENPNFLAHILAGYQQSSAFADGISVNYVPEAAPVNATIVIDDIPEDYIDLAGDFVISWPNPNGTATQTSYTFDIGTMTAGEGPLNIGAVQVGTIGEGTIQGYKLTLTHTLGTLDLHTDAAWLTSHEAQIQLAYDIDIEDYVIMSFYQTSPRSAVTTLTIKDVDVAPTITQNGETITNPMYNTMTFSISERPYAAGALYTSKDYVVSTDPLKVNGFNESLYFPNVFANNDYCAGEVYQNFTDLTEIWPLTNVTASLSGTRVLEDPTFVDATHLEASLLPGWTAATSDGTEDVNVFMEPHCIVGLTSTLKSLKETLFKFSTFITGTKVASSDVSVAMSQFADARALLPNVTGIASFINEFLVKENYNLTKYWGVPIGAVGVMLTQIMEYKLGGVAPMYTNANYNGASLGGQIGKTVLKQKYKFTADQLDTLDDMGLNPIVLAPPYGVMITSQKTLQSVANISDWSYLGHQMAFDLFRKEVKEQVMFPQIGKPINEYYFEVRQRATQSLLNRRLIGSQAIWSAGEVLVAEVNTDETKAEKKFVIKVRVKVTPFSEAVELAFVNVDQYTEIA